jgi:hypothetical protein
MGVAMSSLRSRKNRIICFNTLFVVMLLPASVLAQERQGLRLNAGIAVQSDSNITRTNEETSDNSAIFSPQLKYLTNIGQHRFKFDYQGDFAAYNGNTQYNYDDHNLNLTALFDHSYKLSSEFTLGYQDSIEEPGSNNSSNQLTDGFNQLKNKSVEANLYYGSNASGGQIVLGLAHNQKRYTNNQQSFRNLDRNQVSGTFFYSIAPKTRLLLQASVTGFNYLRDALIANRENDEKSYLAGIEWEATAITSGTFKVGYQQKDYADSRFNSLSGLSYFLDTYFRPNSYTKITIGTSRSANESAEQDDGGFISTGYLVAVEYSVSPRTSLNAEFQQNKSDLTLVQNRTLKLKDIKVGVNHSLSTWLDISLDYRHLARNSNDEIYDFASDSLELSLTSKFN